MRSIRASLVEADPFIMIASAILVIVGILFIYSSGITAEGVSVSNEWIKQAIFGATGLVLMLAFTIVDYTRIKDYAVFAFIAFIALLLYTRFFGRVVNGSRSWIGFGEFGIQPSEFMKVATICYLANTMEKLSRAGYSPFQRFAASLLVALVPACIILAQPDFGTAIVFFPIFLAMAYAAGIDSKYLLFILLAALTTIFLAILPLWMKYILGSTSAVLLPLYQFPYSAYLAFLLAIVTGLSIWGYTAFKKTYYYWIAYYSSILLISLGASQLAQRFLKDYQIMRLIVFLDPSIDPRGSGWNIIQSVTAIGSGGIVGKGFLQGTQSHYRYLPQQSTDFIFSIISEETGFLGCVFVFALFFVILWRCSILMRTSKETYPLLVTAGIFGMLLFHFTVNVGMAMGIMPITGIPLFFLSYGGSSLWAILISMGMVLGFTARRYR